METIVSVSRPYLLQTSGSFNAFLKFSSPNSKRLPIRVMRSSFSLNIIECELYRILVSRRQLFNHLVIIGIGFDHISSGLHLIRIIQKFGQKLKRNMVIDHIMLVQRVQNSLIVAFSGISNAKLDCLSTCRFGVLNICQK